MVVLNIPSEYGYVMLVASSAVAVNFMQIIKIGQMRKKLGIKYPVMTSDKHPEFNCTQRAHQNTLELLPFFYTGLFVGGLRHPIGAAALGACFIGGRIIYSMGYWTGDAERRTPGALLSMPVVFFGLTGLAVSTAAGVLGWW